MLTYPNEGAHADHVGQILFNVDCIEVILLPVFKVLNFFVSGIRNSKTLLYNHISNVMGLWGCVSYQLTCKSFGRALDTLDNRWFPNWPMLERGMSSMTSKKNQYFCLPFVRGIRRSGLTTKSETASLVVAGGDNNGARVGIHKVFYNLDSILIGKNLMKMSSRIVADVRTKLSTQQFG